MKTIHIISHTHWDREWYRTFQQFRLRLVHLVDGLLDILDNDPQYKNFMLDGQTIVLDDYLQMRPENEEKLRRYVQSGRITIGPWHILPDEFLVSPEATIRNLLQGSRTCSKFGPKMMVGYIPDPFGHIGQLPQILRGFGIDSACLQRGLSTEPCEFWWQSPDGSRVLMAYLRNGYGNAAELTDGDLGLYTSEVRRLADALIPNAASPHLLLMWGTDHMEPPPGTSKMIAYANNNLGGDTLIHSTLTEYIAGVRATIDLDQLPIISGELRSPQRHPLLPNVLSARIWIKQRNRAAETLLEKWAEPFSAWAQWMKVDTLPTGALRQPAEILRQAWRLLMENHPHDSICGCSIDQVHDEMRPRFDQVDQIGEEITAQSLKILAQAVNTSESADKEVVPVVVFNPIPAPLNGSVEVTLQTSGEGGDFDVLDETGAVLPSQKVGMGGSDLMNMELSASEFKRLAGMVNGGMVAGMALIDLQVHRDGQKVYIEAVLSQDSQPNLPAWERGFQVIDNHLKDPAVTTFIIHGRTAAAANLLFTAQDVPGQGYRTYRVRSKPGAKKAVTRLNPLARAALPLAASAAKSPILQKLLAPFLREKTGKPPFRIENEFFLVEAKKDGTLTISDRQTGAIYRGLNRFDDVADCGDEYNYAPLPGDQPITARLRSVRMESGAAEHSLLLSLELKIPGALSADRKSRACELVVIPITSRVTLAPGVPRVDIHTEVENSACDHRLRANFPAPFHTDTADYDGHFEIVRRSVELPPFDGTWIEQPRPEVPQRAFTDISDGRIGLLIANRGLPEVETLNTPAGSAEIALTLLRCCGWLSRDDFTTRNGHAGPGMATPGAQMPGKWAFDYAVLPHGAQSCDARKYAYSFEAPLRAVVTGIHTGTLPSSGSFLNITPGPFLISAVKTAEDGRGWIARGYNLSGDEISVTLTPWRAFSRVQRANMAEQTLSSLQPAADGSVTLQVKGSEVVTLRFEDK